MGPNRGAVFNVYRSESDIAQENIGQYLAQMCESELRRHGLEPRQWTLREIRGLSRPELVLGREDDIGRLRRRVDQIMRRGQWSGGKRHAMEMGIAAKEGANLFDASERHS